MHIEVDQSGRIENLTQDSVLAFSNKVGYAIFIHRREKRRCYKVLQARYRELRHPDIRIFAAALFLLLREHLDKLEQITIDLEYPGYEGDIKGILLNYIRRIVPSFPKENIDFRSIGKRSKAHFRAYMAYKRKSSADRELKAEDLLSLL